MARIVQPFTPSLFTTHQKLVVHADNKGLNAFSAGQQVKVVVLQNNRWDNAERDIQPTYIRGSVLEYNTENSAIFPGGKEWRWLDLRDFHLQSDRVLTADYKKNSTDIYVRPDGSREAQRYVYYRDFNGMNSIEAIRVLNPFW